MSTIPCEYYTVCSFQTVEAAGSEARAGEQTQLGAAGSEARAGEQTQLGAAGSEARAGEQTQLGAAGSEARAGEQTQLGAAGSEAAQSSRRGGDRPELQKIPIQSVSPRYESFMRHPLGPRCRG